MKTNSVTKARENQEDVRKQSVIPALHRFYVIVAYSYLNFLAVVLVVVLTALIFNLSPICRIDEATTYIDPTISEASTGTLLADKTILEPLSNQQEEEETSLVVDVEILSNPYNLSRNEIAEQLISAKVLSLKSRVKRFACWHSCLGQFKKKAIRTLYGSSVLLFPAKYNAGENEGILEKLEKKREIGSANNTPASAKVAENNELGEGKGKGFKSGLKATPVHAVIVTSPSPIPPKGNSEKPKSGSSISANVKSKKDFDQNQASKKSTTVEEETEYETEDDGEYDPEEYELASESLEGTEDDDDENSSLEESEEEEEGKGDRIDKKYLEEEEER